MNQILTHMQAWAVLTLPCMILSMGQPADASALIVWGIGSLVIWASYEITG